MIVVIFSFFLISRNVQKRSQKFLKIPKSCQKIPKCSKMLPTSSQHFPTIVKQTKTSIWSQHFLKLFQHVLKVSQQFPNFPNMSQNDFCQNTLKTSTVRFSEVQWTIASICHTPWSLFFTFRKNHFGSIHGLGTVLWPNLL